MPFGQFIVTRSGLWQSLLIALTALSLTACAGRSTPPLRPTVPQLPAQVVQACHLPSPLPDGNVSTLITALLDSWHDLAECSARHHAAVEGYDAARKSVNGE